MDTKIRQTPAKQGAETTKPGCCQARLEGTTDRHTDESLKKASSITPWENISQSDNRNHCVFYESSFSGFSQPIVDYADCREIEVETLCS